MFLAKPLRFRADLVCARSLRGRRRSSERRLFLCPGDSARRVDWQASLSGRGLLMGAAPSERAPDVRTRFASCAHAAVALPERRMPGNLREGSSYWSTSANGAGWPRVPHPCEPACVRGRSPGKMLRRCAPERSAMAIYRLDAFSSVQLWQ